MLNERGCGVLLHPTSLPGPGGIGSLGMDARRFVDLLAAMGMSYWQVLPLTPPGCGNSPYSSYSAFAGNPLLIDLDQIAFDGDLPAISYKESPNDISVDFAEVSEKKMKLLQTAGTNFLANDAAPCKQDFWSFCNSTSWLHNYALFMALKHRYKGRSWEKWPQDLALMTPEKYEKVSVELGSEIGIQKYIQWQFFRQWRELRAYAAGKGIAIIGDIPIFVAYDSADVWSHRDLFLLDSKGRPTVVAGVPPIISAQRGSYGAILCMIGRRWRARSTRGGSSVSGKSLSSLTSSVSIISVGLKLPGMCRQERRQLLTVPGLKLPGRLCLMRYSLLLENYR